MSEFKLAAEPRAETGKGAARRLRAAGRVPAVLYGHGVDQPRPLSLAARDLDRALHTESGMNVLVELNLDGGTHLAIFKELQRHPLHGTYQHVDLMAVRRGEKVSVMVPVHLTGDAPGVRAGGVAEQALHQVEVEAEVGRVPQELLADISSLEVGDVLRAGDLPLPPGVTLLDDPDTVIVSVTAPTVQPEAAAGEEQAGAAAGEEGAGAGEASS